MLHTTVSNLPWFGMGIWAVTYIVLLAMFYNQGYKEKWLGMSFIGLISTLIYAQINLFTTSTGTIAAVMLSVFVLVISIVMYAVFKDTP